MPIYEYQCQSCEHQLEALHKISADPLIDCPSCQKPQLKKLVSAASFRLKGSGWYETDFKTGEKKQLADTDSNKNPATKSDKEGSSNNEKPTVTAKSDSDTAQKAGATEGSKKTSEKKPTKGSSSKSASNS